jgi:hypothetical protein
MADTVTAGTSLGEAAIGDEKWVGDLNATDQVAYRKAKLAWRQAKTAYDAAVAAAQTTRDKPKKNLEAANARLTDANTASGQAKDEAVKAKTALEAALREMDPKSDNQADSARKLAAFQTASDNYKAAVAAAGKKADDVAAAQDAVNKLNDTKAADEQLAEEQYQLDVATADIPWSAADNTFQEAAAVFKSRGDD